MPVLGLAQTNVLPRDVHVAIQFRHLVVGLAAVGLVEALAPSNQRRETVTR